jgi:hypothetical protein
MPASSWVAPYHIAFMANRREYNSPPKTICPRMGHREFQSCKNFHLNEYMNFLPEENGPMIQAE